MLMALTVVVAINMSLARKAQIATTCLAEYDQYATLDSANTYYGDPTHCLNSIERVIHGGS